MKISFPNRSSGTGISICAALNALLNWHKAEQAPAAARRKNVPQIASGWAYRPREPVRRHVALDAARAETAETLSASPSGVDADNLVLFDFINPDPAVENARTKAPLWDRAHAGFDVRLRSHRRLSRPH